MRIHTIGDSHSVHPWHRMGICVHHLGPKLMYSVGKLGRLDLKKHGVKDGDMVIFCLGEIDCRCHIHKHILENPNVINEIVDRYIKVICESRRDMDNVKTAVLSIVPPSKETDVEKCPGFPCRGSDEERRQYTTTMNDQLRTCCGREDIVFIDVYSDYCDNDGFLDRSKSDGNVHINETGPLSRKLKELNQS